MHLKHNKAVTLAELIIAVILVSIMLSGIMVAEHAIRKMDVDATTDSSLAVSAMAIANSVREDARWAIFATGDSGVRLPPGGFGNQENRNFVCFRVDYRGPLVWSCYTMTGTRLNRCQRPGNNPPPAALPGGDACAGFPLEYVGQMVPFFGADIPARRLAANFPTFDQVTNFFTFNVITRNDPAAAPDQSTNPQVTIPVRTTACAASTQCIFF
jgi:hypothetical protein